MGWVFLAILAAGAFFGARALGLPRHLGTFVLAALTLGAAGYALQARPGLPASPAQPSAEAVTVDPGLSELRLDMFGRHTQAESLFFASDALIRSGSPKSAVALLLGGVNRYPTDPAIWTGLGGAYVASDGGVVSPAARLAFGRAMQLAPEHPAPPFFLGVALVKAGEFREARALWERAFRLSPDLAFRAQINERLALLERFLASPAGRDAR
ncbi:tetratricopeptide repeat protein [Sphingomonas sp. RS2018]